MDLGTIAASSAGALCSRLIMHPLDTLRIRTQTSLPIFPLGPLPSLYRGLPITLISVPALSLYLSTYREAKTQLENRGWGDGSATYLMSGTAAEVVSSFVWTPMENAKARMQIGESGGGTLEVLRGMWEREGLKAFFRGYWVGLVVFVPQNALYWVSYENFKKRYRRSAAPVGTPEPGHEHPEFEEKGGGEGEREHTFASYGACSAAATAVACTASNLLDVVKTRYQVSTSSHASFASQAGSGGGGRIGVWDVVRQLWGEARWGMCWKGLAPRLAYTVPGSLISMAVFESLKPDVKEGEGAFEAS
ncbi:mitochondrial carrier [Saitoella complicata NRRL Y-17804]|uniref:Mitochondrial carrier protein n=1 Tax=Saitoella complicata (strain BCRC 22490 / CBS 7301 / JCM 7358 / NBRC 10748 / NRRL Y-17804) TaxID=698492 RepID=A0A0E9N8G4_SAICN|nr:mitochondrial carrier [Saitoella complicata NRRL Y-17804]ODQ55773.1 mitochondrial carrier [Saitoella complicata NRRL Y-17804]GAO46192.1 hypothetical protein G7K_0429-t1 [Saitoella complicata NRRL Y-17804]